MSMAFRPYLLGVLLVFAALPRPTAAQETELTARTHLMIAEFAGGSGGAAEIVLSGGYAVHPQVAISLEGYAIFPLRIGSGHNTTKAVLRVAPTIEVRVGEPLKYGYLKLGSGLDGQRYNGSWKPAWSLVSALGYTVRPRDLKFYFGFEFAGGLALIGPKAMTIGVGGYIGFQL
jgi:hypothetical protein